MTTKIIPNLFIVGAPKCGTTALAEYLGAHRDCFISAIKEPHYFLTDMPGHQLVADGDRYRSLFAEAIGKKVVGEASVFYLYSKAAIANIHSYNPDARLIAMLRNPMEMVSSLHAQLLHSTDEDVSAFEEAWLLQGDRAAGRRLPANCRTPDLLQYRLVARYADQVERMLAIFPADQVKIILFDDFRRDTGAVYRDVLDFLGLDDDGRTDFPVVNSNKQWRAYRFAEFVYNPPPWFRSAWRLAKRLPGLDARTGQRFNEWMQRVNTRVVPRTDLAPEMRARLVAAYSEDVNRLAALLGRDLSSWLA